MIRFPFELFAGDSGFPVHMQYGSHEEDDCYLHGHYDFSELVVVLNGEAQHIVNGESYPIAKGDVFVINQHTGHSFMGANQLKICNIMFQPEVAFAGAYDMKKMPGFQALFVLEPHFFQNHRFCSQLKLTAGKFSLIQQNIHSMMEEYDRKEEGWKDLLLSSFRMFCVTLSRYYNTDTVGQDNAFIKLADAVACIEKNYCRNLSTEELAGIAGYSERQFLRLFRSVFSTTPGLYITELRMKKAQNLLKSGSLSIGEIAWRCGYDDQNYFSRAFKKHIGMTPTEYQSLTWK